MRSAIWAVLAASAALALCACAGPQSEPQASQEDLIADGRSIAEAQCAGCHAVGDYGESPNPAAPHFRSILAGYRSEVLRDELIAGIQVAHPMPVFQLNPQGVDALILYLQSIQTESDPHV